MGICFSYIAPPQDPMFGISRANIVGKLHKRNWKKKAICRVLIGNREPALVPVYIWIAKGVRSSGDEKNTVYSVDSHAIGSRKRFNKEHFSTLEEALLHANGEDDGDLGRETRPAKGPNEHPSDSGPPIVISGMRVDRDRSAPKWSLGHQNK